jgi:NhaP-type Na+/H+ or K+/H+ antiporter
VHAHPAFVFVLAMALGVAAQVLARHLRVPGIVLLLIAGAGLGPDGLGWVDPRALGAGLFPIVHLAVAVILFEGGLNLEISRLRREQAAIQRLVFLGALITMTGAALAVHALFPVSLMTALLFGSLVVVTGPTVVGPLVHHLRLRPRVATVLEAEGVLIDPIGVILAVLMLEIALAPGAESISSGAYQLFLRLSFGLASGAVGGFLIAGLLRVRRLVPEGLENVFVLSFVLLLFQGAEEVVSESGIMAVAIAGVVVGNLRTHFDRDLREFKDQLSVLLVGMLFVLLAADVRLDDVLELGWDGAAVVAVLIFAVRPIGVWVCTRGSELTRAERAFVAWVAPRGIVAAAVASLTASALDSAGLPWGTELRALVFLTIAGTVVLAGVTAGPVASLLKVRMPGRDTVAILGAQGLGLALARELEAAGRPVIFLDSNPQNCRQAEEAGFPVVFGNALQERTLQRARFEGVGTAVGLSANQMLNSVFATRSGELFSVPNAYIAVVRADLGLAPDLVANEKARILFDGPHDVERWDVRSRHNDLAVEHWIYEGPPELPEGEEAPSLHDPGELFVIFCVRRGRTAFPMHRDLTLEADDIVSVALHVPDREQVELLLAARGFVPAPGADEELGDSPGPAA